MIIPENTVPFGVYFVFLYLITDYDNSEKG